MESDRASMHSGGGRLFEMPGSDIRITGYLVKMKTMRKKFFVLRSTSSSGPARLEYYDSEKKFNAGQAAKRVIHLHHCFNINRKTDSRHKHAIALYTKEECFSVVCEDLKMQDRWLALLLEYQNEFTQEAAREHYEFVWQVTIQPKGLGQSMNIRGPYRLCLNSHSIYLFKLNMDKPHFVFQLETVRSVGHKDNVFTLVVGKIAPTGEGELQMHSDDAVVTQNIHETILDRMMSRELQIHRLDSYMKNMDRREDCFERRTFSESLHGSASSLARPPAEFRHRSETFTQGSNRIRPRVERPMSVCTRSARSTSHLQTAVSPGSSPHVHGFIDPHQMAGAHRYRSNSNESKASKASFYAASDDAMHNHHSLVMRPALQEEPDLDSSLSLDYSPGFTSPGSVQLEGEDMMMMEGQGSYMEMNPGTSTPPFPPTHSSTPTSSQGYMDMAPTAHRGVDHKDGADPSSYVPMAPVTRSCSAPIPIHPIHPSHLGLSGHSGLGDHGYLDMTMHSTLPPVKEGGSAEGYVPMSPVANSYGCDGSDIRPDRVRCMLADDGSDFSQQPPTRTYSLGSRPPTKRVSGVSGGGVTSGVGGGGYMDMSGGGGGGKNVSDNGRSCSAPHLVHPHPHPHQRGGGGGGSGRSSTMECSPTPTPPSASPLSVSLRSDDSDAFMELDFYLRPRTASDSHGYRPRPFSHGQGQGQGHRPRSASHGQGSRPTPRRQKVLTENMMMMGGGLGRLSQETMLRAHNASHSSVDSLKVSSSESLKKLSQEVRTKLNTSAAGYMDMGGGGGGDRRLTPSPQLPTSNNTSQHEGYVDMTLGNNTQSTAEGSSYMEMTPGSTNRQDSSSSSSYTTTPRSLSSGGTGGGLKSGACSKTAESENQSPNSSFGAASSCSSAGQDQVYINMDAVERKECSPRLPSPSQEIASNTNAEAYIMYQPAVAPSPASGKENVPTTTSSTTTTSAPKERPGSGKKRGGFFSLRHSGGSGDSGKHSSKKSSESAQSGSGLYAATGGQQFGSLGRDFRRKSKDLNKAARQKSSSFSKAFGISVSKPRKVSRNSPTPPSSLDDEYIDFMPTAAAESQHKSQSSAQDEAYVGFEPGNIPASVATSSSASLQPAVPDNSSSYLLMNPVAASQPKGVKSGKKWSSGVKRSKSKAESCSGSTSVGQRGGGGGGGVTVCGCSRPECRDIHPGARAPQDCQSVGPLCAGKDSGYGCLPPVPVLPLPPALPALPALPVCPTLSTPAACVVDPRAQSQSQGCVQSGPQVTTSTTSITSHSPDFAESQCPPSLPQPHTLSASLSCACAVSSSSITATSSIPPPPLPSTTSSSNNNSSSSSGGRGGGGNSSGVDSSTCTVESSAALVPSSSSLSSDAQCAGYMQFDPARSVTNATTAAAATTSSTRHFAPAVVPSLILAASSSSSSLNTSSSATSLTSDLIQLQLTPTIPSSLSSSSSSTAVSSSGGRKGSGKRHRRKSGDKASTAKTVVVPAATTPTPTPTTTITSSEQSRVQTERSAVEKESCVDNKQRSVEKQSARGEKRCSGGGFDGLSDPGGQLEQGDAGQGVVRVDSVPSSMSVTTSSVALGMTGAGSGAGLGRGRHNSSSSVGVTSGRGGGGGGSNSNSTGTATTRHSLSDLSSDASFPSNILSRQQQPPAAHPQANPGRAPNSPANSQGTLNYAQLDLSSADSLGEGVEGAVKSPRSRSRHSSAADEKMTPLSYATIDFDKSKEAGLLSSSAGKDVKLIV